MTRVFLSTNTAGGGGAVAKDRDEDWEIGDDDLSFVERLATNLAA